MDYRALNEAVWMYSERIRQFDALCNTLQVAGTYNYSLMGAMLLLECGRASEKEDMVPAFFFDDAEVYAAGTLDHIAAHLRSGSAA